MKDRAPGFRRALVVSLPWLRPLYHRLFRRQGTKAMRRTFRRIYHSGFWGGSESASGYGSDLSNTARVREIVAEILEMLEVETLIDAPCGDFNWMSRVDLGKTRYIGVDIVPEMIAENRRRFGDERHGFLVGDITREDLPRADLILCRDCLVHLSFRNALRAIARFKRACKYLLTTTFPGNPQNRDIVTGDWRPLNLELPPFDFPPPMRCESEEHRAVDPIWETKSLGLWRVGDLP